MSKELREKIRTEISKVYGDVRVDVGVYAGEGQEEKYDRSG